MIMWEYYVTQYEPGEKPVVIEGLTSVVANTRDQVLMEVGRVLDPDVPLDEVVVTIRRFEDNSQPYCGGVGYGPQIVANVADCPVKW